MSENSVEIKMITIPVGDSAIVLRIIPGMTAEQVLIKGEVVSWVNLADVAAREGDNRE